MVWTNPSSRPHPRKRRFAQGRRDSTAVQILSPDFLGLSNYKAITLKIPAADCWLSPFFSYFHLLLSSLDASSLLAIARYCEAPSLRRRWMAIRIVEGAALAASSGDDCNHVQILA